MKSNRYSARSQTAHGGIILPLGILVLVGTLYFLSTAYHPRWTFARETIRPDIRDTVQLLERDGSVPSRAVGYAGKTPRQWHRRRWLMQHATNTELTQLLDYSHGAVKLTAYEGLLRRPDTDRFALMKWALDDTTTYVNHRSGCIAWPMLIGEYLMENTVPLSDRMPPPPPITVMEHGLTETEIAALLELYHARVEKREVYLNAIYER